MSISEKFQRKLGLWLLAIGVIMYLLSVVPIGYSYSSNGFNSFSQLMVFGVPFSIDESLARTIMDLMGVMGGLGLAFLVWGSALCGHPVGERWDVRSWQFVLVLAGVAFAIYSVFFTYYLRSMVIDRIAWQIYFVILDLGYIGTVLALLLLPRSMSKEELTATRLPIVLCKFVLISTVLSATLIAILMSFDNLSGTLGSVASYIYMWYLSTINLILITMGWLAYALMDRAIRARWQTKSLLITAAVLLVISWAFVLYTSSVSFEIMLTKIFGVDFSFIVYLSSTIGTIMMFLLFAFSVRRRAKAHEVPLMAGPSSATQEVKAE